MSLLQPELEKILPSAVKACLRSGPETLAELSRGLSAPRPMAPSPVLSQAVFRLTSAAYGDKAAARAAAALAAGRPLLEANHHGFDTHPEMVQGSFFFGLADIIEASPERPAPPLITLAGSLVPLGNPTCPGGVLLGRRGPDGRLIRRFVFPRAESNCQAAKAPALGRDLLENSLKKIEKSAWRPAEKQAAKRLWERFLLGPDFLDRPSFLAQASWLASALWAARFPGPEYPPLYHLESEAVAQACLTADLARPHSPLSRILSETRLRNRLLETLAGRRGCWSPSLLEPGLDRTALSDNSQALGTVLFWELDGRGRRHSLGLPYVGGGRGKAARLVGPNLSLALEPEALAKALEAGRIGPGLFLSCLAFASHGLTSFGGIFQADYRPAMLKIAEDVLETPLAADEESFQLAAGPMAVGLAGREPGSAAWPAGALEFLAAGPLAPAFFREWGRLRLADIWAFTAGAWYQEEIPLSQRRPGWETALPSLPPLELNL